MNLIKKKFKKLNQGNTFIIVVATLSFLAVLCASLLTAVAMCYRMKAYDINSRDNFYYLEQAMDELYAGVGGISMEHFNKAYNDVTDVIVVYDAEQKAYVTMSNDDANKLLSKLFIDGIKKDDKLQSSTIKTTLNNFLSNKYDATSNPDGINLLSVGNVVTDNSSCIIKDVVLKRTASYSTVNTYKDESKLSDSAQYVQSITTDLVISSPKFNIDFSSIENDPMFDFSMISDMGVEITGLNNKTVINGNVYAASDFYNKIDGITSVNDNLNNGVTEKSMYSGFYVDKANVSIIADRFIVPGSIAAMNCSGMIIKGSGRTDETIKSQVWTDNIVLGGYARQEGTNTNRTYAGAELEMDANVYVSDDLELNATGSKYVLNGNYYGYNNARTDERTYSKSYLSEVLDSTRYNIDDITFENGNYKYNGNVVNLPGQSHYNSSSIVVNGRESELDLSKADSVYIAGQAFVEMSKDTRPEKYAVSTGTDGSVDLSQVDENYKFTFKDEDKDNYSFNKNDPTNNKRVEDYRTRESLSVKSNQLAYIPPYELDDSDIANGNLYVKWPAMLLTQPFTYKDASGTETKITFEDIFNSSDIPVVKTVVGGEDYYFYDFSGVDEYIANAFMENYGKLFDAPAGSRSVGDYTDLYDITDWDWFKVKKIDVNVNNLYSNSAISVKQGTGNLTITGSKNSIEPLIKANADLGLGGTYASGGSASVSQVSTLTTQILDRYKKVKSYLKLDLDQAETDSLKGESTTSISPIKTYFNFDSDINDISEKLPKSNYWIISNNGDYTIKDDDGDGRVMGVVLCRGNVDFDSNVKEFHGLIVTSGKIKISNSVKIIANHEIVKAVIEECGKSNNNFHNFLDLFKKDYKVTADVPPDDDIVSMKSLSSVQYEDILQYDNWNKNVN